MLTRAIRGIAVLLPLLVLTIGLTTTTEPTVAQDDEPNGCSVLVEQALEAAGQSCQALGRNTACYGYNLVNASFATEIDETVFSEPAHTAPVLDLRTIETAPLDVENDRWGVAIMNVQANVPNTLPGQGVVFVLLGDVAVENSVPADEALIPVDPVEVVISASQAVNLRGGPGTNFNVVGAAAAREGIQVDGQNAAGDWYRVVLEDEETAWVFASLIAVAPENEDAIATLPVVTGEANTPMQVFQLSTGIGNPTCLEAPDMLVVQSPQDVTVDLNVNGVEITVGSTVALFSERSDRGTLISFGIFDEALQSYDAPDDTECRFTRMAVIDGEALLNESVLNLPTGHIAEHVACYEDSGDAESSDGAAPAPAFTSDWDNVRRLSQNELGLYQTLELIPANILLYDIELPSDEDIDEALRDVEPTAAPTRVVPTRDPGDAGGETNATAVPQVTATPVVTGPDCSTFRVTSPFGAVVNGPLTFFWDGAQNVDAYQMEIGFSYSGDTQYYNTELIRVGANQTNITVDISQYDGPSSIRWKIQVLTGPPDSYQTFCESAYIINEVQR